MARPKGGNRPRPPRCHTCGEAIRVPKGWQPGSATRRHYWRRHPEIMRGESGSKKTTS